MNYPSEHISVCVCTYKRPEFLARLLDGLVQQETEGLFTYSIIVADNDYQESGKPLVVARSVASSIRISYCVEPQQNIALARNQAIKNSSGDHVAFIDDDEFPARDWLLALFKTCKKYRADGVLGPVRPYFEKEPPRWVTQGRFFERPAHETGFRIGWTDGRTGNLLFKRGLLGDMMEPFRAEYGSGGEDRDFFRRMLAGGHVFVWCDEAVVYETVPASRWRRSFMLRRALLRGKVDLIDRNGRPIRLVKSFIAVPVYTVALPFLLALGQHEFMKVLIKTFDHLGRILAFAGVEVVKEKYVTD